MVMSRIELTPEDQAAIAAFKAERTDLVFTTPLLPNTNIVVDDNLRIVDAFDVWACAGDPGQYVWSYCWGMFLPMWLGQSFEDCTDRIGPNTEQMPVYVPPLEEQPLPLFRAAAPSAAPAVKLTGKQRRAQLEAFLAHQRPEVREKLRAQLIKRGHLPPPPPWYCRLWLALTGRG